MASEWRRIPLSLAELCVDTTLRCGQSFRWVKLEDEWHCALQGRVVSLRQDATHLHYKATWPDGALADQTDSTRALLHDYFNLSTSLADLYAGWSARDANFARRSARFAGVRILAQDPWEALTAFICSSNNHISRISAMLARLCVRFGGDGKPLATVGGHAFYDFPTAESLARNADTETILRELGFGYRARYLAAAARLVARERPDGWLDGLRSGSDAGYKAARDALLEVPGVGPKVADCVCLMGLGWAEAVPVDTHVWQIARRDYGWGGSKTVTLSRTAYDALGDHFRGIWGSHAGWAQSVLFTANLRSFAEQAGGGKGGKEKGEGEKGEGEMVKEEKGEKGEGMVKEEGKIVVKEEEEKKEDIPINGTRDTARGRKRKMETVRAVRVTRIQTRSSTRGGYVRR